MDVVSNTERLVVGRLREFVSASGFPLELAQLTPGKMLRTRWAARLVESGRVRVCPETVTVVCAATEMAHTASLCHDDVIDGGILRRGRPTLWQVTGASAAVLVGDLLLCEAADLLANLEGGRYISRFTAALREVCAAELEQELNLRGRTLDEAACLRLARGKTGPLFAFVGYACGGEETELSTALESAGYHVGTLYQLADDLLDVFGTKTAAGKTLGTDAERRKPTLPQMVPDGPAKTRAHVSAFRDAALDCVQRWPDLREALLLFLQRDLEPVLAQFDQRLAEQMRSAV